MGYQIKYSPEDNHKYPPFKPRKPNKWLLPALLVIVLLVVAARPRVRCAIERWFIPGDVQVTKAAFSNLVDDIRGGEPVSEAITAFCNLIIAGGKAENLLET